MGVTHDNSLGNGSTADEMIQLGNTKMIMHDMESMGRRQSSWWTQLNPAGESSGTMACDISFTRRNQCDM